MPIANELAISVVKPLIKRTQTEVSQVVERSSSEAAARIGRMAAERPVVEGLPREGLLLGSLRKVGLTAGRLVHEHPKLMAAYEWLYGTLSRPRGHSPRLENVGKLAATVTRGAQPTDMGFETLKKRGYDAVLNLRSELEWEKPIVERLGMKYHHIALPGLGAPTIPQGLDFLSFVTDSANGKVYFHCEHGADRTGAMAAIYRIAVQDWPTEKALAEMPRFHFHQGFEDGNSDFVKQFAAFWKDLPADRRAQVLHRAPRPA